MAVNWDYFDKFDGILDKYMPVRGEGETKASQIVTAVNKLVYKWYNDGDVFDNTYGLSGWANDLSNYANWLEAYTDKARNILGKIEICWYESAYEDLLKELADTLLDKTYLAEQNELVKVGSIYDCCGRYRFEEYDEDEDGEW